MLAELLLSEFSFRLHRIWLPWPHSGAVGYQPASSKPTFLVVSKKWEEGWLVCLLNNNECRFLSFFNFAAGGSIKQCEAVLFTNGYSDGGKVFPCYDIILLGQKLLKSSVMNVTQIDISFCGIHPNFMETWDQLPFCSRSLFPREQLWTLMVHWTA